MIAIIGISGGCSAVKFPVSESAKLIMSAIMKEILSPTFFICFWISGGIGGF
jgi:hypothetical protein